MMSPLGPLSNPAGVRRYALGVSDGRMAQRMISVLRTLGADRALVFHGEDGLDELTLSGPSVVWRLEEGEISQALETRPGTCITTIACSAPTKAAMNGTATSGSPMPVKPFTNAPTARPKRMTPSEWRSTNETAAPVHRPSETSTFSASSLRPDAAACSDSSAAKSSSAYP